MSNEKQTAEVILNRHEWMPKAGWTKDNMLSAMEEYAILYHRQQLEAAAKELPDDDGVRMLAPISWPASGVTYNGAFFKGGIAVRDKAAVIVSSKQSEISYLKDLVESFSFIR